MCHERHEGFEMIDNSIPRRNYTVYWTFDSKIISGTDRAENLRNDCAAMTALIKQMYLNSFEKAVITETHDTFTYCAVLRFYVEDPTHTNMFLIVLGVLNRKFESIAGMNWKIIYDACTRSCAYADR